MGHEHSASFCCFLAGGSHNLRGWTAKQGMYVQVMSRGKVCWRCEVCHCRGACRDCCNQMCSQRPECACPGSSALRQPVIQQNHSELRRELLSTPDILWWRPHRPSSLSYVAIMGHGTSKRLETDWKPIVHLWKRLSWHACLQELWDQKPEIAVGLRLQACSPCAWLLHCLWPQLRLRFRHQSASLWQWQVTECFRGGAEGVAILLQAEKLPRCLAQSSKWTVVTLRVATPGGTASKDT